MILGPYTFSTPARKIARLIIVRRQQAREYRILFWGTALGAALFWSLIGLIGLKFQLILFATLLSGLTLFHPLSVRYWADRVARTSPGVAMPQTWTFDVHGITVANASGQVIKSPWSMVTRITQDDEYCYVEDEQGGRSPLPLAIIGSDAANSLRLLHQASRGLPAASASA